VRLMSLCVGLAQMSEMRVYLLAASSKDRFSQSFER
jgi:hypothetical protein